MGLDTKTVVEVKALEKVPQFPLHSQFVVSISVKYDQKNVEIDDCIVELKALEEVEKNFGTMRCMLSGDGEAEPNIDQVIQLAQEICKEDVIALLIHKLPILGWEVSLCFFKEF